MAAKIERRTGPIVGLEVRAAPAGDAQGDAPAAPTRDAGPRRFCSKPVAIFLQCVERRGTNKSSM